VSATASAPAAALASKPLETPVAVPAAQPDPRVLAIGLGYPDLRARLALGKGWDLEAKFAFEQGVQVYSGRLYWNPLDLGPLNLELGAEAGYGRFNDIDSLNGGGPAYGGFVGLEYRFARRLRLSADIGPYRITASSEGYSYSTTQAVVNTALYIYLF
jgi:hypothetical protein